MYRIENSIMRRILAKLGIYHRQRSPDLEMQNDRESQSLSALGQRGERDYLNDPYSSKRLTRVPIDSFYDSFRTEINLIVNRHFNHLEGYIGITTIYAYLSASEGITEGLFTRINSHQNWEATNIKQMNEMKISLRKRTWLRPDQWIANVDELEHDLTKFMMKTNRLSLCPGLSTEFRNLLTLELDNCIREHLMQLRLLYGREIQGVWWRFYRMNRFGITSLVPVRQAILKMAPIPIFGGVTAFFWEILPKIAGENKALRVLACIALGIFGLVVMMSLATGRLAFYLWSFHSSVKPLYEHATKSIVWAEGNWPYSQFGSEPTWRLWKTRTDGYMPQAGPYTDVEYTGGEDI